MSSNGKQQQKTGRWNCTGRQCLRMLNSPDGESRAQTAGEAARQIVAPEKSVISHRGQLDLIVANRECEARANNEWMINVSIA